MGFCVPHQLILPFQRQPEYSQESWINDACNQEAVQWVQRWPEWPYPRIVCLYGAEGSGKTHLSHLWKSRTEAFFLSPEKAVSLMAWEWVRPGGALVLENADRIQDETWLFHFYNALQQSEKTSALLTARTPPSQWPITLPDLRSRLQTLLTAEIRRPDDQTLFAVMSKQFHERGLTVKPEVLEYLLKYCERSFAGIQEWVDRLDRKAASQGRAVTIPLIREILQSFL